MGEELHLDDMTLEALALPSWARVSEKRLAHIMRVTTLLDRWAGELRLPPDEARAWHDIGAWHDALRDASEAELREWAADAPWPLTVLHGPAAANRLASEGETRQDVLEAIRWHTLGNANWSRTGRALYMADFLEPGRPFARAEREFLARTLPNDFDGVFRQVVQLRLEWTIREGKPVFPETAALWNQIL
jgi:HD superfamily phosphohydrolase YqeK